MAVSVNWMTDGVDCCHAGFLPCFYVEHAWVYNGVLCQVAEVFDETHFNCTTLEKIHRIKGFARIAVIQKLNDAK